MPSFPVTSGRLAVLAAALTVAVLSARAQSPDVAPVNVTNEMDRAQMLEQLGITLPPPGTFPPRLEDPNRPSNAWPRDAGNPEGNWTDARNNTLTRSAFGLWVTYDDDKVGAYTPIDLLTMKDGSPVLTPEDWWTRRRPEIQKDVEATVWGVMPDRSLLPRVDWRVEADSTGGEGDVPYRDRTLVGSIDTSRYPQVRNVPRIDVVLRVPAGASWPVPVVIVFGGPNALETNWNYVKAQGWAVAMFNPATLQPDNGAGLTSYLIGLVNQGRWRKPGDWGTLVAWTWGIGRILDYFERTRDVDASRVGLVGHSRFGKAAMVAMAYETRLATVYPSAGGKLGAAMMRRHWGQNLESIAAANEYHWMAGNAFKYMGPLSPGSYLPRRVELLPVDAHSLVALAAPRPVFLNGGTTDTWSDAPGTYLAGRDASPVYELLGRTGLVMNDGAWPRADVDYLEGDIGYRVHEGGHTPAPDWPAFVRFARKYFDRR
jgi:hypothetical protein